MQTAIHCDRGISAQLQSVDFEIRMESENSGMISFRELVEQQCDEGWMNRENVYRWVALRQNGENRNCVRGWDVWLCAFLCWKRTMNGVAQHSGCRKVRSVRRKRKKKGERDGRNCRGLWYMKQCRIWKRLGSVLGKKRRKLDGKVDLECVVLKWLETWTIQCRT